MKARNSAGLKVGVRSTTKSKNVPKRSKTSTIAKTHSQSLKNEQNVQILFLQLPSHKTSAADAAAAKGGARVEQHVIVAESEFKASECEKCGICVGLASVGVMCSGRTI